MGSPFPNQEATLVHSLKLSSVGPGRVTGQDMTHNPTNVDLAMKLHYLKYIYYFPSHAVSGLSIAKYKEAMFEWLNRYYMTCGRYRRASSGRPFMKCNDCGVRLIEARCEKTLDEWLVIKNSSMEKMLVYGQSIGPELQFSPPVFIQLTTFKCGGQSLGLNWAHILGDAFAATEYMAALGQIMAGDKLGNLDAEIHFQVKPVLSRGPPLYPLSCKRVNVLGDHWKNSNISNMENISFNLTAKKIILLQEKVNGKFGHKTPIFESLCAIIWKVVAKVRGGSEPKIVTICKNGNKRGKLQNFGNNQVINVVEADFHVKKASLQKIGELVCNRVVEDKTSIEEAVERDQGLSDFTFYGANLTFLDLDGADFYGFEIKGIMPVNVSCSIDGVDEEGVVLVISDGKGGKYVTLIMPEDEILHLKMELESEFEQLQHYEDPSSSFKF